MNRFTAVTLLGGVGVSLIAGSCTSLPASAAALTVTVRPVKVSMPLPAYECAEFSVTTTGGAAPYKHPFDPDEVTVDAVLTGPKDSSLRIPAFWSAPYERKTGADGKITMAPVAGEAPGWRVRIALPEAGKWRMTVEVKDKVGSGSSTAYDVSVVPSHTAGFVRRATGAGKNRYFQYDNGKPYFLVGENVCWSNDQSLGDYDAWFPALHQAGGNFARLWMAFSPLESKETGLGNYDLKNAAYFDEVLSLAQKQGIGCMMAFGTYGEFTSGGFFNEGKWGVNPYNAANGGPIPTDKPDAFFTDPTARAIYKKRLRYLIGRYGAYTSMAFWEFWNEKAGPGTWFSEMASYLKTNDPYKHLVTNSFSTTGTAEVWSVPEMDLTQTHRYGDEGTIIDIAPGIPSDTKDHETYQKPHLMGEFGISWRGSDDKFDPNGIGTNLHNGLWSGAISGNAGGSAIWWWDSYVHPKNLYSAFTGLANFARTVDWPNRAFEQISLSAPTLTQKGPETYSDLALSPTAGWGAKTTAPVVVGRDGQTKGGNLISVLFGPEKPNERSVLNFDVDLPKPSTLILHINTVSNSADLRVAIDGKEAKRFPFDAAPGKGQDFESTKQFAEYGGIYQALFNKDRSVPLPAGRHRVTIENAGGDWVAVGPYTFTGAVSSRYTLLRPYGLQDAATGETLIWLQDPESNWKNDQAGKKPRTFTGAMLRVPLPKDGSYKAEWWDTRKGVVVQRATVQGKSGNASLTVPTFTRDIALRLAQ